MIRSAAVVAALLAPGPLLAADRSFPVGAFERLSVGGSPEVTVTTGHAPSVHASGEAAALDRLDIRVEGGTLKIGTKSTGWVSGWRDHGPVRIAVTVPTLRAVDLAGSGSIAVDRVKSRDFAAQVSGSGRLSVAAADVDQAQVNIAGSGDMTLAGRCGAAKASVAGSGALRLADLRCETLAANNAGSGSITAVATRTATAATMGSGDITITGGGRCTVSTAGSGRVNCS